MEYTARLRTVAGNLRQVFRRKDSAQRPADYVGYAREVVTLWESEPLGLAEWLRACLDGA